MTAVEHYIAPPPNPLPEEGGCFMGVSSTPSYKLGVTPTSIPHSGHAAGKAHSGHAAGKAHSGHAAGKAHSGLRGRLSTFGTQSFLRPLPDGYKPSAIRRFASFSAYGTSMPQWVSIRRSASFSAYGTSLPQRGLNEALFECGVIAVGCSLRREDRKKKMSAEGTLPISCRRLRHFLLLTLLLLPVGVWGQEEVDSLKVEEALKTEDMEEALKEEVAEEERMVPHEMYVLDSLLTETPRSTYVIDSLMVEAPIMADSLMANTIKIEKPRRDWTTWKPNPKRAMWLALVFPGAGQIYNRKYWKLPIFYGGFVGCVYAWTWNNQMYQDYRQAYLDIMDDDDSTHSYDQFLHLGNEINDSNLSRYQQLFSKRKDRYRRWRDLSLFCVIAVYALSVIDAYVDASLSEFDISDDLSLHLEPAYVSTKQYNNPLKGGGLGVQCSLSF